MLSICLLTFKLRSPSVPRAGFSGLKQRATLSSGFHLASSTGGLCDEGYAMEDYTEDPSMRGEGGAYVLGSFPTMDWLLLPI